MARSGWVDATEEMPYVFPFFEIITAFFIGLAFGLAIYNWRETEYLKAVKTNIEIREANEVELRKAIRFCLIGD